MSVLLNSYFGFFSYVRMAANGTVFLLYIIVTTQAAMCSAGSSGCPGVVCTV